MPRTWPANMYLLAYDLQKDRLSQRAWLDYLVRGAALAELLAEGFVVEEDGAVRTLPTARPADEVLDQALRDVEQQRPRGWRALLHQSRGTMDAVSGQLLRAGVTRPRGRGVEAVDRAAVDALQRSARALLQEDGDVAGAEVDECALAALASVVPLRTVLKSRPTRRDRQRVVTLTRRVAAVVPGFERLIEQMHHTRGLSFSAGGPLH
jgi:Golgi phosphoprotein 3 (GPP34)